MKILFICFANVCRSFTAEQLMKKLRPNDEVFSRGIYADPDFAVPQKVKDYLESQGIHYNKHVPQPLEKEDMEKADYIFLMEEEHYELLAERWSQFIRRMHLLAEFAGDRKKDIEDPISMHGKAFVKSMERLKVLLEAASKKLE